MSCRQGAVKPLETSCYRRGSTGNALLVKRKFELKRRKWQEQLFLRFRTGRFYDNKNFSWTSVLSLMSGQVAWLKETLHNLTDGQEN